MMWKEFEELAGYEVSYEDYHNIIEPMYMAVNLSKREFIETLNKKRFALPTRNTMLKNIKALAKECAQNAGHCSINEVEEKLYDLAREFAKRFYGSSTVYFSRGTKLGCSYPEKLNIIYQGVTETIKL